MGGLRADRRRAPVRVRALPLPAHRKPLGRRRAVCLDDILIVGGGIMGSMAAFHLRQLGFGGRVAVVERDPTYALASTSRATGGMRQLFGSEVNIRLARWSIGFYERFADEMGVDGQPRDTGPPDIRLRQCGYLFLADARNWPLLQARQPLWARMGVEVDWLTPEDCARLLPGLRVDDLGGAVLGRRDGVYDPPSILRALRDRAGALGVEYVSDDAIRLVREGPGGRTRGVELRDGGVRAADRIVLAAGAWSGEWLASSGLPAWVHPTRRLVFQCRAASWPPPVAGALPAGLTMTVDPSGLHWRERDGRILLAEASPDDPDAFDFTCDVHRFPDMARRAAERWPYLVGLELERAWAGLYETNRFDGNGLIGPHPDVEGLYLLTGFSGHGVMQAPAAGLALAEILLHGRATTVPAEELDPGRIAAGRPVREEAVI